MRERGILENWKDGAAFNFLVTAERERVFVHSSEFGKAKIVPRQGLLLTFNRGEFKGREVAVELGV